MDNLTLFPWCEKLSSLILDSSLDTTKKKEFLRLMGSVTVCSLIKLTNDKINNLITQNITLCRISVYFNFIRKLT